MTYRNKISFPFAGFVLAATLMASCHSGESSAPDATTADTTSIQAFHLKKDILTPVVKMPGELIAYQQVDLYAKVSSFVKKLYADVGSEVKAGQLLASLEAPEMNAQIAAATSRLQSQEAIYLSSKATYDRLVRTSQTPGTVSQNDLDVANARQRSDFAQYEAAKAAQREVTATGGYLEIRAPFSGVITSRNVSAGAYVGPSGKGSELPIFTLQEKEKLRLIVSIPDAYAASLNDKAEVYFTVKAFPNEQFKAKVNRLAGALDSRLRSQRTEMDVTNKDKRLMPGMVAEVHLTMSGNNKVFVVPPSAILNSTEGTFVIKVENGHSKWVPVNVGRNSDDKTEIFGELNEGDTIVVKASEEIRKDAPMGKITVK